MLVLSPQRQIDRRTYTHIQPRRTSIRILKGHAGVYLPTNGSSCEHVFVARVLVLPIVPNLIDHLHNKRISPLSRWKLEENEPCDEGRTSGLHEGVSQWMETLNCRLAYHLETTSDQGCSREVPTQMGMFPPSPLPE